MQEPDFKFFDPTTGEAVFERIFTEAQIEFFNSTERFVVLNGGFGSGKTEPLVLKAIIDAIMIPDNYILMGRKTYQEIYDVLWKDFLTLCPEHFIKGIRKSPHPSVELFCQNSKKTSTIIFRNLDKMAEAEIKGLNLGEVMIDQAEDTPENVFQGLTFRLRRKGCPHRILMTVNPALNWIYQRAKVDNNKDWRVIEAPSTQNYINLPASTVELYESYKESDPAYYKQYVLGVWDESLLAENTVFAREHIERLEKYIKQPRRMLEDLMVFIEPIKGHRYQMGIDCAEGVISGDNASVKIVDLDTLEEVAAWAGKLPPEVVAEKAVFWAEHYSEDKAGPRRCKIVPEMNAMGLALLNKLRDLGWERIYQREDLDRKTGKVSMKLGFRTTMQSKPLLISNFRHLCRHFEPKIFDKDTIEEMKSFVYTTESRKLGSGAQEGFHDDRIVATLLAFWEKQKRGKGTVIKAKERFQQLPVDELQPAIIIKNGRAQCISPLVEVERTKHWMTS